MSSRGGRRGGFSQGGGRRPQYDNNNYDDYNYNSGFQSGQKQYDNYNDGRGQYNAPRGGHRPGRGQYQVERQYDNTYSNRGGGGGGSFREGPRVYRRDPAPQEQVETLPVLDVYKENAKAHSSAITCMCYVPAVGKVFTGGRDGHLRMWHPETLELIHEEPMGSGVDSLLLMAATAAEGAPLLAVGHHHDAPKQSPATAEALICVLNLATGRKNLVPGHRGQVLAMAADESRKMLFSGGTDMGIKIWEARGPESLFELKAVVPGAHASVITKMEFNGMLFSADRQGGIQVWDTSSTFTLVQKISAHDEEITALLSYQGMLLSASLDGGMKVWPLSGASVKTPHSAEYFYDPKDKPGKRRPTNQLPNSIAAVAGTLSPAGDALCYAKVLDRRLHVHALQANLPLGSIVTKSVIRALATVDGCALLAGDNDGRLTVYTWAPALQQNAASLQQQQQQKAGEVAMQPY